MSLSGLGLLLVSCALMPGDTLPCLTDNVDFQNSAGQVAGISTAEATSTAAPVFTGDALDVQLSAKGVVVWDVASGEILYEKEIDERREVASLSKLLSALLVRESFPQGGVVEIPAEVGRAQARGAHVALPIGDMVTVDQLLKAGMVASANDAMTALAVEVGGSESAFAEMANEYAATKELLNTRVSNATGLSGGEQYSTARDVMKLFSLAYDDEVLRRMLVTRQGVLVTQNGIRRSYRSTNKLLGTYLPVLAAKTGYTASAGENLVVMTYGDQGQRIGAVVLGSQARFADMKTLVEWVWRNYEWGL